MKTVDCSVWYNRMMATLFPFWIQCRVPPPPPEFLDLGPGAGRPAIALSPSGSILVACDSSGPTLSLWDAIPGKITQSYLDGRLFNPRVKQLFNPSLLICDNGTAVLTAWFFAFEDLQGCNPPHILYRAPGGQWQNLDVPLFGLDWNPVSLCRVAANKVRIFGLQNVWADIDFRDPIPCIVGRGSYPSGSKGGGEKEARAMLGEAMFVANSGCKATTGSYCRNSVSAPTAVKWAEQSAYPLMGDDDKGHCSCAIDIVAPAKGYVAAAYAGVVFSLWDGNQFRFPADQLPQLDAQGWSGTAKYPMCMVSRPAGGAYLLWTRGNNLILGTINPDGSGHQRVVCAGTTGAMVVGPDGDLHLAYNLNGHIWYRRVKP